MAIMNIREENVVQEMLALLPELRPPYEKELSWWEGEEPGLHIIFGNILTPYIVNLLESGSDREKLEQAFNFLEDMAHSNDPEVINVLYVTILEHIGGDDILAIAERFMGPKTKVMSQEIEEYWKEIARSSRK
jgi:hypothetical protein